MNFSESYVKGLNYLLANKSDKAIELFVDLIRVDKETMETHLALGSLFRSKGEVDRAIKIHQHLIARPNLDQNQRIVALSELAEDYLKAGLLDRAENLFKELVQINPKSIYPHQKLLEIYSLEKSWREAKDTAVVLYELEDKDSRLVLTHCYCEMAELALSQGKLRAAKESLDKAVQVDNQCIRALLLLIEFHLRNRNRTRARTLFNQLLKNSPQYIYLYLKQAREIFIQHGSSEKYQQFLLQQYQKAPVSSVALELLNNYQMNDQHDALTTFLRQALDESASLEVFDFAFRYYKTRPQLVDEVWGELTRNFQKVNNKTEAYFCNVCGYTSQAMHWNCPSCKSWSTIKLIPESVASGRIAGSRV